MLLQGVVPHRAGNPGHGTDAPQRVKADDGAGDAVPAGLAQPAGEVLGYSTVWPVPRRRRSPFENDFSMFGSDDDKKTPAESAEKKGLFGWFRRKPQTPAAEPPATEPLEDSQPYAEKPDRQAVEELVEPTAPEEPSRAELLAELQPVLEPAPQSESEPEPEPEPADEPIEEPTPEPAPIEEPETPEPPVKAGFFARLRQGLSKTSASLGEGMASLFLGKKAIDDELLEEIETRLLMADVASRPPRSSCRTSPAASRARS